MSLRIRDVYKRQPFKYLAGVGVALKLVLALGGPDRENALFARYCTLAAIGTIADVMRMEGENRTIVSCGLACLLYPSVLRAHSIPEAIRQLMDACFRIFMKLPTFMNLSGMVMQKIKTKMRCV